MPFENKILLLLTDEVLKYTNGYQQLVLVLTIEWRRMSYTSPSLKDDA